MCPPHPGGQPQSDGAPLQQLQRAVPEQLGRLALVSRSGRMSKESARQQILFGGLLHTMRVRLEFRVQQVFTEQNREVQPGPASGGLSFCQLLEDEMM